MKQNNFKERAALYIKQCEAEIEYGKNTIITFETEIEKKKEMLRLQRKSLNLAQKNLDAFIKTLEKVGIKE